MSTFCFGPFSLDTARYELTREQVPVELPRLPMDILILMVERSGDLVLRSEIAARIWPESDPADVVPRINTAVNRIRNSLGDDPETPVYIQTVIGKGYRFIAPVQIMRGEDRPSNSPDLSDPAPQSFLPAANIQPSAGRWAVLLATLLVCIGGLLIWRHLHLAHGSANPVYDFKQLTFNQGGDRVTAASISPDGQLIAYADADGVRLKGLNEVGSRPVPTPPFREFDHLAWLPDGTHLALSGVSNSSDVPEVWLLSIAGGAPVRWRTGARRAIPASQGTRIAFTDATGTELWVANDLWQAPRRIVQASQGDFFSFLLWAADGHTLLIGRRQAGEPADSASRGSNVYPRDSYIELNVDNANITAEVDNFPIDDACLLPNGTLLYSIEQTGGLGLWQVPTRPANGAFLHSPRKLQVMPKYNVHTFSVASNGTIAAVLRYSNPGIFAGDFHRDTLSLDNIHPLTFSTNNSYPHSWTADSTGLYFEEMQEDRSYRIFLQRLDSHDPEPLASLPHGQAYPVLTPDHQWIFFIGRDDPGKPYRLFKVPAAHGIPTPVQDEHEPGGYISCALQGRTCVVRKEEDQRRIAFYALYPDTGVGKLLAVEPSVDNVNTGWAVSPDGSTLALAFVNGQKHSLHLLDLASGSMREQQVPVHSPIRAVSWAPDQKGWFVTTQTEAGSDLFYMDLASRLSLLRQSSIHSWMEPSPDGRKIAFVDQNIESNVWLFRQLNTQR